MKVYITLDYELFLGDKSGTPENCLIYPMRDLCQVASKHSYKYIIFVDAAYLLRMYQLRDSYETVRKQYDLVCSNVKELAESGHDIQLHFHPQWMYSSWDEDRNEWRIDRDHYKLSDMEPEFSNETMEAAKELLDGLVGYKTSAFRAGGFCLENFEDYKELFMKLGIRIDSSVARNAFVSSPIHSYDYRRIPNAQIYRFKDSIKEESIEGDFYELSISSVSWGPMKYFKRIRPKRVNYTPTRVYKDGNGISDGSISRWKSLLRTFSKRNYLVNMDGEWSNLLGDFYDELKSEGTREMIIIGHPKLVSDASVNNLDNFINLHSDIVVCTTKDI